MSGRAQIIRPAAYALIVHEQSLLMCRLCPPEPAAGKWTLPGGGLEFGESPADAVRREVEEETGLCIQVGHLLEVQSQVFVHPDREMQALRFLYSVRRYEGVLRDELEGSTDRCAFIPFEALRPGYTHPEFGSMNFVELARRGLELANRKKTTTGRNRPRRGK